MEKIKVTVEWIVFHNDENGYTVLKCTDSNDNTISVVLNCIEIKEGSEIECEGEYKTTQKYGEQFVASKWTEIMPTTKKGMITYLSNYIGGIGESTANKIVKKFGDKTFEIFNNDINRLKEIKGISGKKFKTIKDSWEENKSMSEIMVFLSKFDISSNTAIKIYKMYGDDSINVINTNPYMLCNDVDGIGFRIADTIALSNGVKPDNFNRISSALKYILNYDADVNGNTYMTIDMLVNSICALLLIDCCDKINEVINKMAVCDELIMKDVKIYLPSLYYAELKIAKKLKTILNFQNNTDTRYISISEIEDELAITYDEKQKNAIRTALDNNVMILTGGPGTGKTTVLKGIITAFSILGYNMILCAPTGKAADRMGEVTGEYAQTIHRVLGFKPDGSYEHDENNPLCCDAILIDESSMINVHLLKRLTDALMNGTKVILIGDVDQLPCIGPGNILRDIILSKEIPVVKLEKIFRQTEGSYIIKNAHHINNGEDIEIQNNKTSDMFFIKAESDEEIDNTILNLITNRLPKAYNIKPKDIQVLIPMKKGIIGTININHQLQDAINDSKISVKHGEYEYKIGDKIIQIKNNYDKGIFNGDEGVIKRVDNENKNVTITFKSGDILYEFSELSEIMLSYAITIHKSQGSEYDYLIVPITKSHHIMMERNLIYTGITRAKKICVIVGQPDELSYAIKNNMSHKRNTSLSEMLTKTY